MSTSRVQLALNVSDLESAPPPSTPTSSASAPAKERPGYANFEVADPPLKLVLFENPGAAAAQPSRRRGHVDRRRPSPPSSDSTAAGLAPLVSEADRCCHAVQDKVWVDAPDVPLGGWEFYTVLADDPGRSSQHVAVCCAPAADARQRLLRHDGWLRR